MVFESVLKISRLEVSNIMHRETELVLQKDHVSGTIHFVGWVDSV